MKFKHGDYVTCEISGNKIEDARVSISGGSLYICSNDKRYSGGWNVEKFEYKYTWQTTNDERAVKAYNIKLKEESTPQFKHGDQITCTIDGEKITHGFISVNGPDGSYMNEAYIVHSKKAVGDSSDDCHDKMGKKYAWYIGCNISEMNEDLEDLENFELNYDVADLKLKKESDPKPEESKPEEKKFIHGERVECSINGTKITDAKISIDKNNIVHICQNERAGAKADDLLGYKNSYMISEDFDYSVKEFKIKFLDRGESIPKKKKLSALEGLKEELKTRAVEAISGKIAKDLETELVDKVVKKLDVVRTIKVKTKKGTYTHEGLKHEKTETILDYMAARMSVLMVGPAGSGKTYIAVVGAHMLGLVHYAISVNEQTSKTDFLGFMDATGTVTKTSFRKAYEEGGVFIIDEIDAGNPNVLTVVNSALSNDFCSFPDGLVKRHEDFICVCTANTFGEGESLQYIGRNVLDSATKDRFTSIFIDYSDGLEKVLLANYYDLIQELRTYFKDNSINFVVSTRGGIRLEDMHAMKGGKLTKDIVVDCLNLHQEIVRDGKVNSIIKKHV